MNIVSGSFEHMIDIANQTHGKLVVDFPVSNPSKSIFSMTASQNGLMHRLLCVIKAGYRLSSKGWHT
jgi:hypothetical protein